MSKKRDSENINPMPEAVMSSIQDTKRTVNGVANIIAFIGLVVLTVGASGYTFDQGWHWYGIVAANGTLMVVWGLMLMRMNNSVGAKPRT